MIIDSAQRKLKSLIVQRTQIKWISLFTSKSGSNKKGEKQTHKLN